MATLRKRGERWHVQVRRRGRPSLTRSFLLRSDALAWGRQHELEADRQDLPTAHRGLKGTTVADLVRRYRDEVVPRKRGADRETFSLNAFLRHALAETALSELTAGMVSAYCTERLQRVKPGSVNRELDILRHVFEVARRHWDVPLTVNAFASVTRIKGAVSRERRLQPGERERLHIACLQCRNPLVRYLVELALETGMRRGEILRAGWDDVSFERRTLHIPLSKNGHARTIPLSGSALAILCNLREQGASPERVLPITENTAKMAWKRIVKRAGLVNLRLHDLRHEAISRFFELGLSVPEVALISGHRDLRMLFRYTHLRPEAVALKLASLTP
jgi:integrase